MNISIAELAGITAAIFKKAQEAGVDEVELDEDYYWFVPRESIYDISTGDKPQDLDLGSLFDDYCTAKDSYKEEILVIYNLKHLSSILRYLSIKYTTWNKSE